MEHAWHAGGRGFESRRSSKITCKPDSSVAYPGANDRRSLFIPRTSRTGIAARTRPEPRIPATLVPATKPEVDAAHPAPRAWRCGRWAVELRRLPGRHAGLPRSSIVRCHVRAAKSVLVSRERLQSRRRSGAHTGARAGKSLQLPWFSVVLKTRRPRGRQYTWPGRGGRAVEGGDLESRWAWKRLVGSNPTPAVSRTGFDGDRVSWVTRSLRRA